MFAYKRIIENKILVVARLLVVCLCAQNTFCMMNIRVARRRPLADFPLKAHYIDLQFLLNYFRYKSKLDDQRQQDRNHMLELYQGKRQVMQNEYLNTTYSNKLLSPLEEKIEHIIRKDLVVVSMKAFFGIDNVSSLPSGEIISCFQEARKVASGDNNSLSYFLLHKRIRELSGNVNRMRNQAYIRQERCKNADYNDFNLLIAALTQQSKRLREYREFIVELIRKDLHNKMKRKRRSTKKRVGDLTTGQQDTQDACQLI